MFIRYEQGFIVHRSPNQEIDRMKKFLALMMTVVLATTFSIGCGDTTTKKSTTTTPEGGTKTVTTEETKDK